jgi:catechol 2,3-dioxygenase-like lactoylglutathione lyase family enzyme
MKLILAALAAAVVATSATSASAQLAPPDANGITYGHIHLNVRDIEVHKKFWAEHFGGEVVQMGPLTTIKFPGMYIALTQAVPTGGSQGTVMDHFGFKVQSTADIVAKFRAAGLTVQSEFTGSEGFPNAYLMGPDDVRIELQEDKTQKEKVIGYHLHFQTPDFMALMNWYIEKFGLKQRQRGTIATTTDVPGMNLSFARTAAATPPTKGRSLDHIGFEVVNLVEFCKQLEAKGVKIDVQPRDIPSIGVKVAFLTDPNGTYIELTEGLLKKQ